DEFAPLPLAADGPLGVGSEQYGACKGCASFGCTVSAIVGSYGEVAHSRCFDAACNSRKVSAWRRAVRSEKEAGAASAPAQAANTANAATRKKTPAIEPTNHVPQRLLEYRVSQWRHWVTSELMANADKNRRVLIALVRAGQVGEMSVSLFAKVVNKLVETGSEEKPNFAHTLRQVDTVDAAHLDRLTRAIAAAAAFGVTEKHLVALLNYLGVDERRHFKLNQEFLALHTLSELEALAGEMGLRAAMGVGYKLARAKKKPDFIAAPCPFPALPTKAGCPPPCAIPENRPSTSARRDATKPMAGERPKRMNPKTPMRRLPPEFTHWKARDVPVAWIARGIPFSTGVNHDVF
ncbi:MAG: hypothetical protein LBF91_04085, partial [Azoarcus sp.]|nr:hypothetical protein [Azoarcus sp.]